MDRVYTVAEFTGFYSAFPTSTDQAYNVIVSPSPAVFLVTNTRAYSILILLVTHVFATYRTLFIHYKYSVRHVIGSQTPL